MAGSASTKKRSAQSAEPTSLGGLYSTFRDLTTAEPTASSVAPSDSAAPPTEPGASPNPVFTLSAEQLDALRSDLRALAAEKGDDLVSSATDFPLTASLYARKGDVPRALALCNTLLRWRRNSRYDDETGLLDLDSPGLQAVFRAGLFVLVPGLKALGGQPVLIVRSGRFEPRRHATKDMAHALVLVLEYLLRTSNVKRASEDGQDDGDGEQQQGQKAAMERGIVVINDMNGFAPWKVDIQLLRFFFGALSGTLPVRVSNIMLANAPLFARMLHGVFGGLLSKKINARVRVLEKGAISRAGEVVETAGLPAFAGLGGTTEWGPGDVEEMAKRVLGAARGWGPGSLFKEDGALADDTSAK